MKKKQSPVTKIQRYLNPLPILYKGGNVIMRRVDVIGTNSNGSSVLSIVSGAKQLGLKIRAVKIRIEDIFDEYTLPAIAQIRTIAGVPNVVSIDIAKHKEGNVIIVDSEQGILHLKKDEFKEMFPGSVILLMPQGEFKAKMF
ncbi:MAG: cysteine peptidase family C39 domain-containing protein [Culicoidibacterales bacterium]